MMGYGKDDYIGAYVIPAGLCTYRLTLWRSSNPEWVAYRLTRKILLAINGRSVASGTSAETRPAALLMTEVIPELRRTGHTWADDLEAAVRRKWRF